MFSIDGYDNWKLDYPKHYDDEMVYCSSCNDFEVEFEDEGLCGDCYYEKNHGLVIAYLDDAIRHLQKHFDKGTPYDIKHADTLLSTAQRHIQEIGGQQNAK